jgi:hypothetical protein
MKTWINLKLSFAVLGFLSILCMGYESYTISNSNFLKQLAEEKGRLSQIDAVINEQLAYLDKKKLWKRYLSGQPLSEKMSNELQNYFPEAIGLILNSENNTLLADTFTKQTENPLQGNLVYQAQKRLQMSYVKEKGTLFVYVPIKLTTDEKTYSAFYSTRGGLYTSSPLPGNSFPELLLFLEKSKYRTVEINQIELNAGTFNYFSVSINNSDKILYLKKIPALFELKSFYAMLFFFFIVLYPVGKQQEYYLEIIQEKLDNKVSRPQEKNDELATNYQSPKDEKALESKRQKVFNAELKQLITEISSKEFEPAESKNTLVKYLKSEISYDLNPVLTAAISQKENKVLFQTITQIRKKTKANAIAFLCFSPKLLSYSCYVQDGLTIFDEDNFFLNINDSLFNPSKTKTVKVTFDEKIKNDHFLRKRLLPETIRSINSCFFMPLFRFDVDGYLFFSFHDDSVSEHRINEFAASQLFKDFLLIYRFSARKKRFIKRENSASYLRRETQISLAECMGKLKITHFFLLNSISVFAFRSLFKKLGPHLKSGEKFIMQAPDHLTILLDAKLGSTEERFPWLAEELDLEEMENLSYPEEGHVLLSYL